MVQIYKQKTLCLNKGFFYYCYQIKIAINRAPI